MTEQFDVVEPRTGGIHQKVVLDETAKDGPVEKLVVGADVQMRIRKIGNDWDQFGIQIMKVGRARYVIKEFRVMYWDVAALRRALAK
jgi:hypothetical protein